MSDELRIRLFGPFEARLNGLALPSLSEHRKAAELLALLMLHADNELGNEWVASHLWPNTGSLDSLKHSVSDLRQALGPMSTRLLARAGKLSLDLTDVVVDVVAFDRAFDEADSDPSAKEEAIELHRGPLLQDWYDDWVETARKDYEVKFREALESLADNAIKTRDYEVARRHLERLTEIRPDDHSPRIRLMAVLMRSREHLAAQKLYEEYRGYLRDVHGLLPPRQMTELYEQIPRPSAQLADNSDSALVEEEPIGGAMRLDSRYYVVRSSDKVIHSAVKRRDCIVRIQGPRQTGKTSLLARVLEQARQDGALVVTTDFQALGPEDTETIETFFRALAQQFHRAAKVNVEPSGFWDTKLSANANFQGYVRDVVLEQVRIPVVWGIDEADRIFDREYRGSVFGLFRSWHNRRSLEPDGAWQRFTLIMAYSAEARMLIPNPNESPFNVGTGETLQDFTREQVDDLNARYGNPLKTNEELARLMTLVGGHPFLVRSCLYEMKTRPATLEEIENEALRDDSLFAEHLDRVRRTATSSPERLQVVMDLLQGTPCADRDAFSRLRSSGVLAGDSMSESRLRCLLYESWLKRRLL